MAGFLGRMSLLLTASYDQLVTGLTVVQNSAVKAVRTVGDLGPQATQAFSGIAPVLGRVVSGLASVTSGAGDAGLAIRRLGESISIMASKRDQAERRGSSFALPIAGGAAAMAASFKAIDKVVAQRQQAMAAAVATATPIGLSALPQIGGRLPAFPRQPTPRTVVVPPTPASLVAAQTQAAISSSAAVPHGWNLRRQTSVPLGGWAMLPPNTGTGTAPGINAAAMAQAQLFEAEVKREAAMLLGSTASMNFGQRMAAIKAAQQQAHANVVARLQAHALIANQMSQAGYEGALALYNRAAGEGREQMRLAQAQRLRATVLPLSHQQMQHGLAQKAAADTLKQEALGRGRAMGAGATGDLSLLLSQARVPFIEAQAQSKDAAAQVDDLARMLTQARGARKASVAKKAYAKAVNLANDPNLPPEARAAADAAVLVTERALRQETLARRTMLARLGGAPGPGQSAGVAAGQTLDQSAAWLAGLDAAKKQRAAQELAILQNGGSLSYGKVLRDANGKALLDKHGLPQVGFGGGVLAAGQAGGMGTGGAAAGGMGLGGWAAIGAGVIGLGLVTKHGAEFEKQMVRIGMITRATGEDFDLLKQSAIRMGQTTLFSASQAAEGMQALASSAFSARQITELMPIIANAATGAGVDMATTGRAATTMAHNFGMSTPEIAHFLDVVGYASSRSGHSYQEFMEAINMGMPILKAAGMSVEEMSANLMILSQKGLSGSTAGTLMRNLAKKTVDSSNEAQVAMRALGIEPVSSLTGRGLSPAEFAKKFNDATKGMGAGARLQLAEKMVETRAAPGFLAFANDTKAIDQALRDVTLSADGFSKKMAEAQAATLSGQWKMLRGDIEALALRMYDFANGPLHLTISLFEKLVGLLSGKYAGGVGKVLSGTFGGAATGFAGGSIVKLLSMLFPAGAGIRAIAAAAPKVLGLVGATAGFLKSSWQEIKGLFGVEDKAPAHDKAIDQARALEKKIAETGQGADVTGVLKLSKALMELRDSLHDSSAAMRVQAAMSVEQFAIQSGGIPVVRQMAEAYKVQVAGVQKLTDVEAEQVKVGAELQGIQRLPEYLEALPGFRESLELHKQVGATDSITDILASAMDRATNGPRRGKRTFGGPFQNKEAVREQMDAFEEAQTLAKNIGSLTIWQGARSIAPGAGIKDQAEQLERLEEKLRNLRQTEPFEKLLATLKTGGVKESMVDVALAASAVEGMIAATAKLPDAGKRIEELRGQLKQLNVSQDGLLSIKYRLQEINEMETAGAQSPAIQQMILQHEARRALVLGELQSTKKLAEAEEQLWQARRLKSPPGILANLQKEIDGSPEKLGLKSLAEIDAQSAIYHKRVQENNRIFAETRRPEEIFAAQAGDYMDSLRVPKDIQQQIESAQKAVKDAMAGDNADDLALARKRLEGLDRQLQSTVLGWDTFERAVKKAGKAMDDALGGSRLPPLLTEGSQAAMSRINHYAEETDPNRAVLGSILTVLEEAKVILERSNELVRDIRDKTTDANRKPAAKPKPAAND